MSDDLVESPRLTTQEGDARGSSVGLMPPASTPTIRPNGNVSWRRPPLRSVAYDWVEIEPSDDGRASHTSVVIKRGHNFEGEHITELLRLEGSPVEVVEYLDAIVASIREAAGVRSCVDCGWDFALAECVDPEFNDPPRCRGCAAGAARQKAGE